MKKLTNNRFITKALSIHGDKYIYSKSSYTNNKTNIVIICKKHGEFLQKPIVHLRGSGCKQCSNTKLRDKFKSTNFIFKSKNKYGDKFSYNNVTYINNNTLINMICKNHGNFSITPKAHLKSKNGCPKCSNNFKITDNSFKKRASDLHNNKYNYDLVTFNNSNDLVNIVCLKHGEFKQKVKNHLVGYGCKDCAKEVQKKSSIKYSFNDFLDKANTIHNGKYSYSDSNYINMINPIKITCKHHGSFFQIPNNHINLKHGCIKCSGTFKLNKDQFLERAKRIHKNKFDYSYVTYKNRYSGVQIICKKHGIFMQTPKKHLNGQGCPKCNVCVSKKETKWLNLLNNNRIIRQHPIKLNKRKLIVDGYDPKTNTVYEFYGDYWHGYPFKNLGVNKSTGTSFNTLFYKTLDREQLLLNENYNVISIWESDFERELNG